MTCRGKEGQLEYLLVSRNTISTDMIEEEEAKKKNQAGR
jgi:hypothetical protein